MGRSRFTKSGEIIRGDLPTSSPYILEEGPVTPPYEGDKGTFMVVTLIASFLLYGLIGAFAIEESHFLGFLVGGFTGFVISAIYNVKFAEQYGIKDYVFSIGAPLATAVAVGIGYALLEIVIVIVLLLLFLGGG